MKKRKLDVHSLPFRLWLAITLFAVVIILSVGGLELWGVTHQYESLKQEETTRLASEIRSKYMRNAAGLSSLHSIIRSTSMSTDFTIIIRDKNNMPVTDEQGRTIDDTFRFNGAENLENEILKLNEKLKNSEFDSASAVSKEEDGRKTLEYACTLQSTDENTYYMYIFSPLYIEKSSLSIIRTILEVIAFFAIIAASFLAWFLSKTIARPIRSITESAAEMARGNYSVKFRGGSYTETKELADTLTMAESEMDKAGQYQQDVIANVSHDLRTPLTMIQSYAEMIRDISGDNPEKRNAHLKVIIDESKRLTALVNDMLNLSRMQSQRMVLVQIPYDLKRDVIDTLASYKIMEEQEGYHFKTEFSKGPIFVNADEEKIKQVMNNLLSNAVKYCGEDKEIIVSLKRSGRTCRFSVTDHGMGISEDEIPHIWDKYYKSSTHHVRSTTGTGIGLSIVKEILNLHHAEFDVKSTVGKGSTFWFELPVIKPPKQPKITSKEKEQ
ncbi:MAG: HAMP domain-containing sensor histidine kinase [Eubacteriales bacterium]|nr:HAMP domain-containing sensor histidine kinase [Eubacteriales bacterium]